MEGFKTKLVLQNTRNFNKYIFNILLMYGLRIATLGFSKKKKKQKQYEFVYSI